MLQTSTSIRNWKELPDIYNKNGRYAREEIDAQVSFLYGIGTRLTKVPASQKSDGVSHHFEHHIEIQERSNANLLGHNSFQTSTSEVQQTGGASDLEQAKLNLFENWLAGNENRSQIQQHVGSMRLLAALGKSIQAPGTVVVSQLNEVVKTVELC